MISCEGQRDLNPKLHLSRIRETTAGISTGSTSETVRISVCDWNEWTDPMDPLASALLPVGQGSQKKERGNTLTGNRGFPVAQR